MRGGTIFRARQKSKDRRVAKKINNGYTILEVMLFLAISGVMFVVAAIAVDGKQANAEFRQGMNSINSQVQTVINDVSNGFYPSNDNFQCLAPASGPPQITTLTQNKQGQNLGCVFMGKAIQFGADDDGQPPYRDADQAYNVYTIVGRQFKGSQQEATLPTNFTEAQPKAVAQDNIDLTDKQTLEGGLKIINMFNVDSEEAGVGGDAVAHAHAINGVAFFSSFGSYETNSNNLQSGSQNVQIVLIPRSTPDTHETEAQMIDDIKNSPLNASNVVPNPRVVICFDGGRNHYGTLTIGGTFTAGGGYGQRLATKIQVYNSKPDGC